MSVPHNNPVRLLLSSPPFSFPDGEMGYREGEELAQGNLAGKEQSQDSNLALLALSEQLLKTLLADCFVRHE